MTEQQKAAMRHAISEAHKEGQSIDFWIGRWRITVPGKPFTFFHQGFDWSRLMVRRYSKMIDRVTWGWYRSWEDEKASRWP